MYITASQFVINLVAMLNQVIDEILLLGVSM